MNREFKPGALVKFRKRNWVILPSTDSEIIIIKPLGGAEEEITGIYIPLQFQAEIPTSTEFPNPTGENLGDFESAKILFNASKLSFRNAAGPFRSLARLSFRPRSYQMLPLIMALKQNPIRLLIADDVGVGKTIEALLIARELLDRGEIKSLAVICLPHLCEQWKEELKNKFSIEAEIIRSSTVAKLERQIQDDRNVHQFFPFQIISIDYIKSERRKQIFTQSCPELVIVDEAHTCAKPSGASIAQQQRYHLLHQISKNANQNLILISATPHSGKQEEFQSLLGLLKPKFENVEISVTTDENRKELANHFVQRRRADVEKWMNEETPFPKRIAEELSYTLSPNYENLFAEVLNFAKGLTKSGEESKFSKRLKYWSALALLRGVISSPAAGVEMLRKKAGNYIDDENFLTDENESNPVLDDDFGNESDTAPTQLIEKLKITDLQSRTLKNLADKFENLKNLRDDKKAQEAYALTLKWLKQGFNPIIFCRYIATANYLGDLLKKELAKDYKNISVEIVTGEIHDEQRKEIIAEMGNSPKRVLIATSCLSEGINLQESFTAILHYDLPWNPNKLEQREGRIDRYGQNSPTVKIMLLYGKNNPIDGVVLKVLIRKAREIRRTTGIAVPFPENSKSILDAVLNAVLLQPEPKISTQQIKLDFGESTDIIAKKELEVTNAYQKAQKRETLSRSIFAQHSIKADEIEADLKETDLAIGNVKTVNDFVVQALKFLGVQVDKLDEGYRVFTTNLPKK
ncbi:MAG: helicase, partial [Calditrichaeota bacterium]